MESYAKQYLFALMCLSGFTALPCNAAEILVLHQSLADIANKKHLKDAAQALKAANQRLEKDLVTRNFQEDVKNGRSFTQNRDALLAAYFPFDGFQLGTGDWVESANRLLEKDFPGYNKETRAAGNTFRELHKQTREKIRDLRVSAQLIGSSSSPGTATAQHPSKKHFSKYWKPEQLIDRLRPIGLTDLQGWIEEKGLSPSDTSEEGKKKLFAKVLRLVKVDNEDGKNTEQDFTVADLIRDNPQFTESAHKELNELIDTLEGLWSKVIEFNKKYLSKYQLESFGTVIKKIDNNNTFVQFDSDVQQFITSNDYRSFVNFYIKDLFIHDPNKGRLPSPLRIEDLSDSNTFRADSRMTIEALNTLLKRYWEAAKLHKGKSLT